MTFGVANRRQPPYSSGGTLQLLTEAPSILAGTPARDKREVILQLAPASTPSPSDERRRWAPLIVVCFAQLMIVLDVTIVNVALPAIQHDLGFSQANLTWVVNAFLVTFGSLLLLAGRLGDLLGRRRVFLAGIVTFTAASLLCGIAPTDGALI